MAVHSDWGDWLPKAVADARPTDLDLWYLGCNGFVLKSSDGTTLLIDPYMGTGDPPRTIRMVPIPFDPADLQEADAVLGTHEHTDHVHGPSQAPILEETGATFYGPDASIDVTEAEGWTEQWDVDDSQIVEVSEDDTVEIGELTVTVKPANDPDAEHPIAYVIEHPEGTFVHGGDARPGEFEEIGNEYDVDVAALAFGSTGMILDRESREPKRTTWYNDENMIIEAANELAADSLLPTHWDMWKGMNADPSALHHHASSFEYPEQISVIEIGDRLSL